MINTNTIARATAVIAVFTLLSKVLGFVREMAMAHVFGASAATDAFLVAYTLPNIVFAVLGGALVVVAVPVFSAYAAGGKREEAWRVFSIFTTVLVSALALLILAGMPFSRQIVWIVAPGLPEGTALLAAKLVAVMLPAVLFFCLANLFAGLLNANSIFGPASVWPLVNNIFVIASILLGIKSGIYAVAFGALAGNVAAAAVQIPYLRRAGFAFKPSLDIHHPGLKQVFSLMLPVMVGTGVGQAYLLIDRILASGLAEGSISALNYASKLILLPQGIFVTAVGTAIFTSMSSSAARGNLGDLARTLSRGIKMVLLVAFPAGVGLAVLRDPVVRLLFGRGAFDEKDAAMTSLALLCFSFGLAGQCLNPILSRGFFALRDTVTPVKTGIITVAVNLAFSLLLIGPLKHGGLALANSIAANFNVIVLFWLLSRRVPELSAGGLRRFTGGVVLASGIMGLAVAGADALLSGVLEGGAAALALRAGLDILAGVAVLAAACEVLKLDEYLYLRDLALRLYGKGVSGIRGKHGDGSFVCFQMPTQEKSVIAEKLDGE
ncbi:MAG: murein biosynthesis integral membrane protein MurJ [Peptococcaceae bacterium]|nr:murein biosynthesis integral membrane protein MurJ [Peptococcaceae bacterium]